MKQIINQKIAIGNVLPQYAIKMIDCKKLQAINKTLPCSIEVITDLSDSILNISVWYKLPISVLNVPQILFEDRVKNMLKPLGFKGFIYY